MEGAQRKSCRNTIEKPKEGLHTHQQENAETEEDKY
jgi:hypothetical protein